METTIRSKDLDSEIGTHFRSINHSSIEYVLPATKFSSVLLIFSVE